MAGRLQRLRQRYGKRITVRLPFQPPFVIREVLTDRLPGPNTEGNARQLHACGADPDELLERDHLDVEHPAAILGVPDQALAAGRQA